MTAENSPSDHIDKHMNPNWVDGSRLNLRQFGSNILFLLQTIYVIDPRQAQMMLDKRLQDEHISE